MTSSTCEKAARCAKPRHNFSIILSTFKGKDISVDIIRAVAQALSREELVTAYTTLPESERNNPNSVKLIHNETHAIWSLRWP